MTGCENCGRIVHDGEARVLVGWSVDELIEIALATDNTEVRRKALCAAGLLDAEAASQAEHVLRQAGLMP